MNLVAGESFSTAVLLGVDCPDEVVRLMWRVWMAFFSFFFVLHFFMSGWCTDLETWLGQNIESKQCLERRNNEGRKASFSTSVRG